MKQSPILISDLIITSTSITYLLCSFQNFFGIFKFLSFLNWVVHILLKLETRIKTDDLLLQAQECHIESIEFDVSSNSTSDYSLYLGRRGGNQMVKVVLLEAETDKTIDDNAVAQVIGYFLASTANYLGQPPIGIIISQQMARLFFSLFRTKIQFLRMQWWLMYLLFRGR